LHRLVCIAPAATIINLPPEWAWRGILSALPHRYFMNRFMVNWLFEDCARTSDTQKREVLDGLISDAVMSLRCFRMKMLVAPTVLTDDELRALSVESLFMVGENEKIYPPADALRRIQRLAPQIQTELVAHAGHDLPIVQADFVNKRVSDFLLAGE
jgi:pimeloyl-ACP methyl ester carboxylesterase